MSRSDRQDPNPDRPRLLTPELRHRLEDALHDVGAFGEVRLVVQKGRVRFIETVRSESVEHRLEDEDAAA